MAPSKQSESMKQIRRSTKHVPKPTSMPKKMKKEASCKAGKPTDAVTDLGTTQFSVPRRTSPRKFKQLRPTPTDEMKGICGNLLILV